MKPRYELRFAISAENALLVREFVRAYLELDECSVGRPDYSYSVHTVYLDSDDWKIYWRTVRGDQDRWKLRLRYYDDPDRSVFCEVKHQTNDLVVKHRAGITRRALAGLLDGHLPHSEQLLPADQEALDRFLTMMLKLSARPKLHISWLREAYVGDYSHSNARVTMDRSVRVGQVSADLLSLQMDKPLVCSKQTVILELRFTERYPDWFMEMGRVFGLGEPLLWPHTHGTLSCGGLTLREDEIIHNIVL